MGAGRGGAPVSDAHGFSEGVGLCLVLVAASPLREPGHLRQGLGWNREEGDPCSRTKMGRGGGLRDRIWEFLGARVVGGALLKKLELLKERRGGGHLFDGSRCVPVGLRETLL